IPGAGYSSVALTCLAEAQSGERVRLERVTEQVEMDLASLSYLSDHKFTPGAEAVVSSRAPDGTITLDVGGTTMAIGSALALQLFVANPAAG
ncbi:MAG: FeoA family protein, partial [Acidimicrobiales bacterium]